MPRTKKPHVFSDAVIAIVDAMIEHGIFIFKPSDDPAMQVWNEEDARRWCSYRAEQLVEALSKKDWYLRQDYGDDT